MVMGASRSVDIKCRRCGKMAKAEDFVLDYVYKMAVCPSCIKARKAGEAKTLKQSLPQEQPQPVKEEVHKPAGWDAEDEYLEKVARQKAKAQGQEVHHNPSPYSTMSQPTQTRPTPQPAHTHIEPQQSHSQQVHSSPQPASKPSSGGVFGFFSGQTQKTVSGDSKFAPKDLPKQEAPRQSPQPVHTQSSQPAAKPASSGGGVFGFFSGQTQKTVSGDSKFAPKDLPKQEQAHEPHISHVQEKQSMDMEQELGLRHTARAPPVEHRPAAPGRAEVRDNPDKTRYKCRKCSYEFWFNLETGTPRKCPYCSTEVNRAFM